MFIIMLTHNIYILFLSQTFQMTTTTIALEINTKSVQTTISTTHPASSTIPAAQKTSPANTVESSPDLNTLSNVDLGTKRTLMTNMNATPNVSSSNTTTTIAGERPAGIDCS